MKRAFSELTEEERQQLSRELNQLEDLALYPGARYERLEEGRDESIRVNICFQRRCW